MTYSEFLKSKHIIDVPHGFEIGIDSLNASAWEWQKKIVRWNLLKGRSADFEDCGLGKTLQQLIWADEVCKHTRGNVLIFAPLSVAAQTVAEGLKFGIHVTLCRSMIDVRPGINITNYEMMGHFDASRFVGVVLDESSILKSFTGKTTQEVINKFHNTPYKLACTATPAPNDYMELGNHAEFLGIMKRAEMLATFFVHDGGDTAKWRLKGHAQDKFWEWVASWAVVLSNPADLGYSQDGYNLPPLNIVEHMVGDPTDHIAQTLSERREARKASLNERVAKCAEIANLTDESVLVWCDLNAESKALTAAINGAVEITGSDKDEIKAQRMHDFTTGIAKKLVSKPKIAGWGMNWQHCNTMIFCGLSDSFEAYYQAVRRCWRFGQKRPVTVHIVTSAAERAVKSNIERKQADAQRMAKEMQKFTRDIMKSNITSTKRTYDAYNPEIKMQLPDWLRGAA